MPNWCSNYIIITGNEDRITDIHNDLGDKEEWMQALIPLEGEEWDKLQTAKVFSPLSEFYGSKWYCKGSDCQTFDTENDCVVITCDSAWSPFDKFCKKVAAKYNVRVEIEYNESGCDFAGRSIYDGEEVIEEVSYSYHEGLYRLDAEHFWMEISDMMSYYLEDHTLEEVLAFFPFLEYYEQKEIKAMYEEAKK
jgi:hypothetical protein